MTFTRTFKISGSLTLLGTICLAARAAIPGTHSCLAAAGIVFLILAIPVFGVSLTRHLLRGLLWRVGSRLFVSYLLIAIVPIPFVAGLAYCTFYGIGGQLAGRRAEAALLRRLPELDIVTQRLSDRFEKSRTAGERQHIFDAAARDAAIELPGLAYVYASPGGETEGAGPESPRELAGGKGAELSRAASIARLGDRSIAASVVRSENRLLVVYVPLTRELRRRIEAETDVAVRFKIVSINSAGNEMNFDGEDDEPSKIPQKGAPSSAAAPASSTSGVGEEPEDGRGEKEPHRETPDSAARSTGRGPWRGRWIHWFVRSEVPIIDWKTGSGIVEKRVRFYVQSSLANEYRRLYGLGSDLGEDFGAVVFKVILGLTVFTIATSVIASLIAALLVFRIARATRRLSLGFEEIEKGNFSHRARLRGQDQLAGLIAGFNRMAENLGANVEERAKKEALELELQIARDLQRRLLPTDFDFPGIEIASDFHPAAAIGGDFFHFVAEGPRRLVVVIADVSGHGLPTGIVMASAKASLSALASIGGDTTAILKTLDSEIRRTTDRRTFVTLAHARFLLDEESVELTNAGHLYPYRITFDGQLSSIENPSRPLGVGLPADFVTMTAPLAAGDLWVFLSDGIVEATDPKGDQFGFERLENILRDAAGSGARALCDRILSEWRTFTGGDSPEDDRTLIVLEIGKRASPPL